MKKLVKAVAILLLSGASFFANAQTDSTKALIVNGKIHGIVSGTLYMHTPGQQKPDSTQIVNGEFKMNVKPGKPGRRGFEVQPGNWQFWAFADVQQMDIDVDTTDAMHYISGGKDHPSITRVKQTGSPLADAYEAYMIETGQYEAMALMNKQRSASKDSAAVMQRRIDELRDAYPKTAKAFTEKYVDQYPTTFAAISVFKQYFRELRVNSPSYLRTMLARFSGPAKDSEVYQDLSKELVLLENAQVGKLAPNFTLQKRDKTKLTLSSTRGSVVMLDFWASWCVPCRAGIPALKKTYAKYHPKGFDIISIANDRKRADWTKALDKEKMPWMQVIDVFPKENASAVVSDLYSIHTIPHFVLIGKKGEILASGDDELMKKKLAEIFK